MTQDEVLKLLKKQYSEKFSHLCRDLFPTLLEQPKFFYNLITNTFAPNQFLYDDLTVDEETINQFKDFIFSIAGISDVKEEVEVTKTPAELLKEAGYTLYECEYEKEIQSFKKYYAKGEELCTFDDHRLKRCHVFFAVKDNVDEIKRENFAFPERQDEYGTSVISIQFTRGRNNTLSIKNRYNHTVNNPDATFFNNLDNIISGLTKSFNKEYGFNTSNAKVDYELPGYVQANDGKYYKYNYERHNIYFCPNNVIINHFNAHHYDHEKYIVMDYFLLNLQKDNRGFNQHFVYDAFLDHFLDVKSVYVERDKTTNDKTITINGDIKIVINELGKIVSYSNPHLNNISDCFLTYNNSLREIDIPNVEIIGNNFLDCNPLLEEISLPNVRIIGDSFLKSNRLLKKINIPNVKSVGKDFLFLSSHLNEINMPNCEEIGDHFMASNNNPITKIDFPNVKSIGNRFLSSNKSIIKVNLPNVEVIGYDFLCENQFLKSLNLPKVIVVGNDFLKNNTCLSALVMPNLKKICDNFMICNNDLEELSLPKVRNVGSNFISCNKIIKKLYMPSLKIIGGRFLDNNRELTEINLPNVEEIDSYFLSSNRKLLSVNMPQVKSIGDGFMDLNTSLTKIDFPYLLSIGKCFINSNNSITEVNLPNVEYIGNIFLSSCDKITSISLPKVIEIGSGFLRHGRSVKNIYLPKVEKIGDRFLYYNNLITEIDFPNLTEFGEDFLYHNHVLRSINLPNVDSKDKLKLENVSFTNNNLLSDFARNHETKLLDQDTYNHINNLKVYSSLLANKQVDSTTNDKHQNVV